MCSAPTHLTNGTPCYARTARSPYASRFRASCVGANPVVCTADQCHDPGTCNPATGVCSAPTNKTNGTACNDGNACTQTDSCQNGSCVGANPMVCTADQCHDPGTCNPATGVCSAPTNKTNGTACNDGNPCTQTATFQPCTSLVPSPVVCTADQCHDPGTCNPATGVCSAPTNKTNGTACNDRNPCTQTDTCQN